MKRTVAVIATTTLTATLLTGVASPSARARNIAPAPATATSAPTITWNRCADERLRAAKARCGMLRVPLNHAAPDGRKIKVAVSRIKATAPAAERQGPLLVNPGGPGGSGLGLAAYLAGALPKRIASTYDIIGFDPRGVGDSRPALKCKRGYAKGPRPAFDPVTGPRQAPGPNEIRWLKRSKAYAAGCAKHNGDLLPFLRTEDAARDMDVLRQALGADKINYYGYSYGTYLGSVYATLFPTHTRRLVFDGVVDPREVWYSGQLAQDRAFEVAIGKFWGWVARHHHAYGLGRTAAAVEKRYYADRAQLRRHPVGQIGAAEWNDSFVDAGYAQFLWPDVARNWAAWKRGNHGPIQRSYAEATQDFDNGFGMYLAVQCADVRWPDTYAKWRRDAFETAASAPFMTWNNVWFNAPCLYWAAPPSVPVPIDGSHTPELLLVNTTLDAATPYGGALEIRRRFPNSVLVAQVGSTTHADTLDGNRCVDSVVLRYLRTGKLPHRNSGTGADVRCKRSPLPKP
ncbi:MAG TPA: alpha/beta hydrolase [Sporichthya sp.]|nr:alpha/beta hydrolase [Sporichthya sp.]